MLWHSQIRGLVHHGRLHLINLHSRISHGRGSSKYEPFMMIGMPYLSKWYIPGGFVLRVKQLEM